MTETLEKNCHCAECHGHVEVSIKTICIASQIILTCKDKDCGFTFNSAPPASTTIGDNNDDRERTIDFAINVNYILGFLWAGDGGTEAGGILSQWVYQTILQLRVDCFLQSKSKFIQC
jgi:hypothetical protein